MGYDVCSARVLRMYIERRAAHGRAICHPNPKWRLDDWGHSAVLVGVSGVCHLYVGCVLSTHGLRKSLQSV